MDLTESEATPRVAGEKRPRQEEEEDGGEGESVGPPVANKKKGRRVEEEMRKVAEIVLVLSGLGRIRGGRVPTKAEVELMGEARARLAEMCEGLRPRDVVGKDEIEAVLEDLGLNGKLKPGFLTSKLSVSDKFLLSKRKMEESKKFAAPSATYPSTPSPTSFGSAVENRGTSHIVRTFPSDRSSQSPMASGGFPVSSPLVHLPATTSSSLSYQSPTSEGRASTVSSGLASGHLGRESSSLALPRVERLQHKVEGGSNGSHAPQVHVSANLSTNHPLVNAPTWSVHPQPASSVKAGSENKIPNHNHVMVEGSTDLSVSRVASQAPRDQTFRPFITQTSSGNLPITNQPLQGMNFVQASSFSNNSNEISKIVQRVLKPRLPEHPTWNPPSREYMNKALTCQSCRTTINDVESVLLCDACEKGFHLKCIPNLKGIPRGAEWHCIRCMSLSHGKPLPPKYGRVMRSASAPKLPSNPTEIQSPSDKKVGTSDPKVNEQKITLKGSSELQSPAVSGTLTGSIGESVSNLNIPKASILQENSSSLSGKDVDQRSTQHTQVTDSQTVSESDLQPPVITSGAVSNKSDQMQSSCNYQDNGDCTLRSDIKQDEQDVLQESPVESSGPFIEVAKGGLSDSLQSGEWIGEVFQIVDGRKFYQSCCIDGRTYKLQDHALYRTSHDKLIPSKLKGMWEDSKTGSKWVIVNRCYYPDDLPESAVLPSTPENSEVYESNNDSTVAASLIQSPCDILPPSKFNEMSERRNQLGTEPNQGSVPVFLCRWLYDELKQSFQPVST
ncbi:BAH domain-containing protein [Cephalotus follicularis]|uniref:BAH domain-containing protein n=1 Tax=Cephalotus follicularis TaxID=3775 RepID=A0A1Q3D0P2_CEPFO|nr:BAH domain-containing protein [Cephalotus follicularis]